DAEQRLLLGHPPTQEVVLLLEPGVVGLFAHVHQTAEHEHRVEAVRRRPLRRQLPLDELLTLPANDLAEELRANERPVGDGEDAHYESSITLRMPSWASISSNPRLTSSSERRWLSSDSASISPPSQRSTSCGTCVRPLTPPNELPATRRPVIRNRGTTSSSSPLPATPQTVASPHASRAASTAWRMTATLPVAPNV